MNSIRLASDPKTSPSSAYRLRERAIALRRAGRSRREIKEILGIGSNQTLSEALQGEPPPEWTRRPRAKDDLHARARELREQGLDYEEIAAALGVSKSSVSLWVRDMPRLERLSYEECRKRSAEGAQRYWAAERPVREARREAVRAAAAAEIGPLTEREILIAGAIAYWCEGAKSKAHRRQDRVVFVNSDPALIRFFLRFLDTVGIGRKDLTYRVHIHETADVLGAERFWHRVTQADPRQFRRTVLKTHNPRTVRANVGDDYHGCLRVEVRRSGELYRQIDGWTSSIMADPTGPDAPEST
jgi:transcriptional regulator with XRE-family HTH domain